MKKIITYILLFLTSIGLHAQIEETFHDCLNQDQIEAIFEIVKIHDKFVYHQFGDKTESKQAWINYVKTGFTSEDESQWFLPEKELEKIYRILKRKQLLDVIWNFYDGRYRVDFSGCYFNSLLVIDNGPWSMTEWMKNSNRNVDGVFTMGLLEWMLENDYDLDSDLRKILCFEWSIYQSIKAKKHTGEG